MEQFDFRVTTDLTVINPQEITCNYEETRAWLAEVLAPYKGLVVAEDAIAEAKSDRAKIRKVRDAIDAQRKSVEKEWNAPLARFKEQANELSAMCDEAAGNIDTQVKAFQQKKADEKVARLRSLYDRRIGELGEYIPWDHLYNPRWVNVTFAEEDAEQEIIGKIEEGFRDLETIENLQSEFEDALLLEYAASHDLRKVLEKKSRLESMKAEKEALREREAPGKVAAPPAAENEPVRAEAAPSMNLGDMSERILEARLAISGTREQLVALKQYMNANGIAYHKI